MASVTPFCAADLQGFLHRPSGAADRGLVLAHGALCARRIHG